MSSIGNVMPVPQQQFCDTNGVPYALGSLTFYAAGTTNPLDTYFKEDLASNHKNSNPLTLDAAGRAIVYWQPKAYRVILKDANGVQIYDQDTLYGIDINVLLGNQTANTVFAGPSSGTPAAPAFRALTAADLPPNVITTTSTGTQNDFAPGLVSGVLNVLRCNNATLLTVDGFSSTSLATGTQLMVESVGAGQVDLAHQNTGSTAVNRLINFATSASTSLSAGVGTADYVYDGTTARWRLVTHVQGAAIEYSATSTITGWTGALSPKTIRYILQGRLLSIWWALSGTSNSVSTSFTIPYTAAVVTAGGFSTVAGQTFDNGSFTASPGQLNVATASSLVALASTSANAAWTNSGTKQTAGVISIEVQ